MAITVDVVAVSWDCWSIWCLVVSGVLVCGGAWCPVGTEEVRVRVSLDVCVGVCARVCVCVCACGVYVCL